MDTPPLVRTPAHAPGADTRQRDKSLVGTVISDRYRVDELIARGGMGAVYRGYHRYLKKRVAVKVLQSDIERLPDLVQRFEREAIAGAHVDHPNVAAATDFGRLDDGSFFLVVEYARGITIAELVKRERVAPMRAAHIARQLASALDAVHALGIVHRDIKSRNILVAPDARDAVKLIDFGLARVPMERLAQSPSPRRSRLDSVPQRITGTGEIFGTVAYLAPESAFGMDEVDARSDLYALGVVFYEMLAGRRPYVSVDPGDLFIEQRLGPPRVAARSPGVVVPREIEEVVMRLLARDPAERFQRGADVVAAIDAAVASIDSPPSSTTTTALAQDAPVDLPLRSIVAPAIALAVLAIGAVVALAALPRAPRPKAREVTAALQSAPVAPVAPERAQPAAVLADPGLRRALVRAARGHDRRASRRALLAVIERDASSLRDPEIAAAARDVAAAILADGAGDGVLDALARRAGGAGLDVLYAIVERGGRSRVAARAAALLGEPGVIQKASPALAIAFAVRAAPCSEKLALLDRAVREGDARALTALETQGRACYFRNQSMEMAILALRARITPR